MTEVSEFDSEERELVIYQFDSIFSCSGEVDSITHVGGIQATHHPMFIL